MAKRESKVSTKVRAIAGEICVDFKIANGDAYTLSISDLPDSDGTDEGLSMTERLTCHGAIQKVVDSVAGEKDIEAVSKKIGAMLAQINNGQWFAERTSDGVNIGVLAEAIAEFRKIEVAEVVAKLVGKSKEEKQTLRKHGPIAEVYDRIVAERAAAKRAEQAPKVAEEAEAILESF